MYISKVNKSRHLTFVHNGNITSGSKHMINKKTQLSLTNRARRLEVSQSHRTLYHSTC